MIARRAVSVLGSVILCVSVNSAQAELPHNWERISPAEAGFQPDVGEKLDDAVHTNEFDNLHAVIVARGGKLVLERYYEGEDKRTRGPALGTVKFGPAVKHDLRSVSKSIVGLLYGVALADGKVADLDQSLVGQFPAYADLPADPKRERMTVRHALSMTLGTEWDEDLPYFDPRNSETAMDLAADRYRYVLERPMVTEPGTQWNYNGGATAVLAKLISRGTGQPLLDYARETLFEPLGITDVEWVADSGGEPFAASGLRMRPRDLAKIGQLVLDGGMWGNSQLVPAEWLDQSLTPRVRASHGREYGYHWWLGKLRSNDQPWMAARGNGGQRLFIVPSLELVVVITAGNYNKPGSWKLPVAVISKVLAAMTPLPELNANNECLHEDFENRVSAAGQCLVLDIYKSPKANNEPLLVVFVHGDGLRNRGYFHMRLFQDRIKDASSRNLIYVAITRPGYHNGRETSTGDHHYYTGDAFRPYIVKSVVTAILRLAKHYNAKKVAVIGHSGGGIILAGGLGSEPDFQPDLAVTIASVFNLPAWVAHRGFGNNWPTEKSISPHKFTAKVSPAVEVVVVSGSADTNALSEFSAEYVDLMKRDGKNARHIDLEGATHNGILLDDERLWTMLSDMLRKLE